MRRQETPRDVVENCPIDRLSIFDIDPVSFHQNYRLESKPLIITDVLQNIPEWTLELLEREAGQLSFPVRCYGAGHFDKPKEEWGKYCEYREMVLSEYITELKTRYAQQHNHYMGQVPVGETPLARLLREPLGHLSETLDMEKASDMAMWLGPTGHTEPLHWDCGEGTVLMLSGAKKVVLFAPEQSANLYPFPLYGGPAAPWFSKVYVENPDLTAFPKYSEAEKHKIEITLNAGEVLYIPVYWWHELSSIGSGDYTCSVNRFWRVKPMRRLSRNKVGMALYLTQMGLMSVNRLAQSLR